MARLPTIFLVPVDGSPGAAKAAAYGATLATPLAVPLRLLFAFPRNALEMLGMPAETVAEEEMDLYSPEYFAQLRDQRAARAFAQAREAMGETSVPIEEVLLSGEPAQAILAHAVGVADTMIIMGSRGLSRFSEMLVGSVSHRVLHHARCPVTIVHE